MRGLVLAALVSVWPNAAATRPNPPIQVTRIVVMPDTSGTLDQIQFREACLAVVCICDSVSRTGQIRELSVLPWATMRDSHASPAWQSTIPTRKSARFREGKQSDSVHIFSRVQEQAREKAARADREEQARLDSEFDGLIQPVLERFKQQVMSCRQGRASCTAVDAMLSRCSQESPSTLCVVITDGLEECSRLAGPPLPIGARTLVVLVPANSGSALHPDMIERQLRARAPWALIVPSFRLTDSTIDWKELLLGPDWGTTPSVETTVVRLQGGGAR